jgi:hypothetical protein
MGSGRNESGKACEGIEQPGDGSNGNAGRDWGRKSTSDQGQERREKNVNKQEKGDGYRQLWG